MFTLLFFDLHACCDVFYPYAFLELQGPPLLFVFPTAGCLNGGPCIGVATTALQMWLWGPSLICPPDITSGLGSELGGCDKKQVHV